MAGRRTQDITIWDEESDRGANVLYDDENDVNRLAVDALTSSIDFQKVGLGLLFNVNAHEPLLAKSKEMSVIIQTGSLDVHMTWSYYLALQGYFRFIEGATYVPTAVALTPYNRNRQSLNTALTTFLQGDELNYTGGTIIVDGDFGANGGIKSAGGGTSAEVWILKRNTTYVLTLGSDTPSNKSIINIIFYEVDLSA